MSVDEEQVDIKRADLEDYKAARPHPQRPHGKQQTNVPIANQGVENLDNISEKDREKDNEIRLSNEKVLSMQQQHSEDEDEEKEWQIEFPALKEEVKRLEHGSLDTSKYGVLAMPRPLRKEGKQLKRDSLDTSKYPEWGPEEICEWILGLGDGRLVKYEKELKKNLTVEEVDGSMLNKVNSADLKGWGIIKFADKKYLEEQIELLVANPAPMMATEGAPSPTAFTQNKMSVEEEQVDIKRADLEDYKAADPRRHRPKRPHSRRHHGQQQTNAPTAKQGVCTPYVTISYLLQSWIRITMLFPHCIILSRTVKLIARLLAALALFGGAVGIGVYFAVLKSDNALSAGSETGWGSGSGTGTGTGMETDKEGSSSGATYPPVVPPPCILEISQNATSAEKGRCPSMRTICMRMDLISADFKFVKFWKDVELGRWIQFGWSYIGDDHGVSYTLVYNKTLGNRGKWMINRVDEYKEEDQHWSKFYVKVDDGTDPFEVFQSGHIWNIWITTGSKHIWHILQPGMVVASSCPNQEW